MIALELPAYQKKENWGASETFYQLVRTLALQRAQPRPARATPACNVLGPTALGFRHRDDLREILALLQRLGIAVNVVAPLNATPQDLTRLGEADFTWCSIPRWPARAAGWLERQFQQPADQDDPDRHAGHARVHRRSGRPRQRAHPRRHRDRSLARALVRALGRRTYLTGKRVFVFGDATHAIAAARVPRTNSASRWSAWVATAESSRAKCARPRPPTVSSP